MRSEYDTKRLAYEALADIKSKIHWNRVEDVLPKKNDRVLVVCTNSQNQMQQHISICEYWGNDNPGHKPMWSGHKDVTHWANLPELPSQN